MANFRTPIVRRYTGFDRHGIFVGSASVGYFGDAGFGWKVWIVRRDPIEVMHEHEAKEALLNAGAVRLESSDGIQR